MNFTHKWRKFGEVSLLKKYLLRAITEATTQTHEMVGLLSELIEYVFCVAQVLSALSPSGTRNYVLTDLPLN